MKGRARGKKNLVPWIGSKTHNYEYQFVVVKYSQGTSEGCVYDLGFVILSASARELKTVHGKMSIYHERSEKLLQEISQEM